MEPIFSNACTQTKQNLLEMTRAVMPGWYKLYCRIFTVIFIIFAAVTAYMGQYVFALIFIVLAVLLFIIYGKKTSSAAMKIWKKNFDLYGKDTETRIFFYEDTIVGKNLQTGSAVKTEYDKIEKIIETPSLYVLVFSKNIAILADKNGFISGGGDFADFIRKKCVNAR